MRVYLDTSVVGGACGPGYADDSVGLIEAIESGLVIPIVSDVWIGEVALAPPAVHVFLSRILGCGPERIGEDEAAINLRDAYLTVGVLPPIAADDALHVGCLKVMRADVIASWNMRHLVDPDRVRAFNGVNLANGYGLILVTGKRPRHRA